MDSKIKAIAQEQFGKVWSDSKMVNFCMSKMDSMIQVGDKIFIIDKPCIQKSFWFGYHDSYYDTESYDNARSMAAKANNNVDYFVNENIAASDFDRWIDVLSEYVDGHTWKVYTYPHYYGQAEDCKLTGFEAMRSWEDPRDGHETLMSKDEALALINGYKAAKERFKKRLDVYVNKYGLAHVHTSTYWMDA